MKHAVSATLAILACSVANATGISPDDAREAVAGWSALSEKTPLADVTLSNGDFAGSETATAEIGRTPDSGDKFFKAGIGEK